VIIVDYAYFRAVKNRIKAILQFIFGYKTYLKWFAWYKVRNLKSDVRENDFFYFLEQLPETGIVLDIGANLGFLAAHIAMKMPKGKVIAFEPMPDNVETLKNVIRKFKIKNIEVQTCALGDENGEAEMVLPVEGGSRQQGLSHMVHKEIQQHNHGIHFKVPVRRLDDMEMLRNNSDRVVAIKMDVENFEQFVLRGAQELLKQHQPLVYIELWDNDNRKKCFEILHACGYHPLVHVDGNLIAFDPIFHKERINLFFRVA
jgi:FkbM family methyltransferase